MLAHLEALHSALKEEEQCGAGELRPRGLDQTLRRVRPRLEVGPVEAEEGADDGVEPEQGEPEKRERGEAFNTRLENHN